MSQKSATNVIYKGEKSCQDALSTWADWNKVK